MALASTHLPLYTYRFMAYLKWGDPERQFQDGEPGLPDDLMASCVSWRRMALEERFEQDEIERIHAVVASHLIFVFVPSNLNDGTTLVCPSEFTSRAIEVTDVDFSRGPLPSICAKAFFELSFSEEIPVDTIYDWQEKNDYLDWAITFRYDFDFGYDDGASDTTADSGSLGVEIYGPLTPDDPGITYAEKIGSALDELQDDADDGPVIAWS